MKLQLSTKKQAILEEMGISLFLKKSPSKPHQPLALSSQASASPAPTPFVPAPNRSTVHQPCDPLDRDIISISADNLVSKNQQKPSAAKEITNLDLGVLRQTLASQVQSMSGSSLESHLQSCQSCELGTHTALRYIEPLALTSTAQAGETPSLVDWLIVADAPKRALDGSVVAFAENSQSLLDAILKHLSSTAKTSEPPSAQSINHHITHTVKCLSASQQIPSDVAVQTCLVHLSQQIKLLKPKLILVMGLAAAHALLKETPLHHEPLGKLRSKVHRFENTPMIVTYAPEQMMRSGETKSNAWNDFCLAHSLTH